MLLKFYACAPLACLVASCLTPIEPQGGQGPSIYDVVTGLEVPVFVANLSGSTLTQVRSRRLLTGSFPSGLDASTQRVLGVMADGTILFSENENYEWDEYSKGNACTLRAAKLGTEFYREWSIPSDRSPFVWPQLVDAIRDECLSVAYHFDSGSGLMSTWLGPAVWKTSLLASKVLRRWCFPFRYGRLPMEARITSVEVGGRTLFHQSGVLDDRFWLLGADDVAQKVPRKQCVPSTCELLHAEVAGQILEMVGLDSSGVWSTRYQERSLWKFGVSEPTVVAKLIREGYGNDQDEINVYLRSASRNPLTGSIAILATAVVIDHPPGRTWGPGTVHPAKAQVWVVVELRPVGDQFEIEHVRLAPYSISGGSSPGGRFMEIIFKGKAICVWMAANFVSWDEDGHARSLNANFYSLIGREITRVVGYLGNGEYLLAGEDGLASLVVVKLTH